MHTQKQRIAMGTYMGELTTRADHEHVSSHFKDVVLTTLELLPMVFFESLAILTAMMALIVAFLATIAR